MITPALLILASASLVATALQRLGRAVDRARVLLQMGDDELARTRMEPERRRAWAGRYADRAKAGERAVTAYFVAVVLFVASCLGIAADRVADGGLTWLPVGLAISGMGVLLLGAYQMLVESRFAMLQIREEIEATVGKPRNP